jgi:hypothetical protein
MKNFKCTSFNELVFLIDDIEFKYSECKVMSEKEHKKYAHVELILKSPCGHYAEVLVTSDGKKPGKRNIVSGEYDGMVVDQDVATAIAKLTQTYQDRQQELNEVLELNRKLKKQGKET